MTSLHLGTTYLIVKDWERSIAFYEALLEMKVTNQNFNRWAEFHFHGQSISLFNPKYDEDLIASGEDISGNFNPAYLEYKATPIQYGNNFVLNFWVEDLNAEYERVKTLNIGTVSEILFINVAMPYYCFMVVDPDGNQIEITGTWKA